MNTFLTFQHEGIDAVLVVDRCNSGIKCAERLSFTGISGPTTTSGPLQLGGTTFGNRRLKEQCLENIVLNSEVSTRVPSSVLSTLGVNSVLFIPAC